MNIKKLISFLAALFIFIIVCPSVFADNTDFEAIKEDIDRQIINSVDEQTADILREKNINIKNPGNFNEINIKEIVSGLWNTFTSSLAAPFVSLGRIIAAVIICMCVTSFCGTDTGMSKICETLCAVTVIIVISDSLSGSFETIRTSLDSMNTFMKAYIPVFAGTSAAMGGTLTAGSYSSGALLLCEILSIISEKILVPFLSAVLAFSIVSAINPSFRLSQAAAAVNKFVVWALGIATSLFTLIFSLQGITGSAVDGKTAKVLKFAFSGFIPVIGNSLTESVAAVKSSLGIIRAGVGIVGIAVIFIIVVRPVLAVLAIKLSLFLARVITELLGSHKTSDFLKNANSVMSVGLSVVICGGIVFIVATAVTMTASLGG